MRTLLALLIFVATASYAQAQDDAAAQAAQQAMQQAQMAAQQANQQAMQLAQMAAQQAQQNVQQAMDQVSQSNSPACCFAPSKPKFSVKPGTYASPVSVRITDSMRGAIIYYTTDGWSPTTASNRYLGPITINSTTNLQAIAVAPYGVNYVRSFVVSTQYVINAPAGAAAAAPPTPAPKSEVASAVSADDGGYCRKIRLCSSFLPGM